MVKFILSPREHHGVRSREDYVATHARFMAKARKRGSRFEVHDSPIALTAWVAANQWQVQCECRAGNSVDPEWGIACCFGCGAIHRDIVFPADWREITLVLLERDLPSDRAWLPGETLDDLRQQNAVLKVRK